MRRYWGQQKPPLGVPADKGHILCPSSGLWLMNEGSGNIVQDLSGNGNGGTINGDFLWTPGKYGTAVELIGVTDNISANTPPNITNAITYVVRFNSHIGSAGGDQVLIRLKDTVFKIDNALSAYFIWYSDIDVAPKTFNYVFAANTSYEVAVTQIGTTYALYVNGLQVQTGETDALDLVSSVDLILGAYNLTGTWDLDGLLEYAYIYNRALTASEIAQLYEEPFCMVRTRRRRVIFDEIAGVPPTSSPYYYREIASRRIA